MCVEPARASFQGTHPDSRHLRKGHRNDYCQDCRNLNNTYPDCLYDTLWGALFKYDVETGTKTLVSGYGNGPDLVGDGPIWPVTLHIVYSNQRLQAGSDGTVFVSY